MNYVGKRTTPNQTFINEIKNDYVVNPVKKLVPPAFKFLTGWDLLSKVSDKFAASHLEKEIDTPAGKTVVRMPLSRTERVGLATGELLLGSAKLMPLAALWISPVCKRMDATNEVCKTANIINEWERWALQKGKNFTIEAKDHIVPWVKEGYKLVLKGMKENETYIVTHLALWGSGLYLLRSGYKDYKASPLSAFHIGKIKIERKSNTLSATAWKIAKTGVKLALGTALIGTSIAYTAKWIGPAMPPVTPINGTTPGPAPTPKPN